MKYYITLITSCLMCISFMTCGFLIAEQESAVPVDKLLPPDTLFLAGVEDCALMDKYAESMPFTKILQEEEVVAFLKKPTEFVKESLEKIKAKVAEKSEALAAEIDKICDLRPSRYFMAITHLGLPSMEGGGGPPIPDLGIVFGVALQKDVDPSKILRGVLDALAAGEGMELSYVDKTYEGVSYVSLSCPYAPEFPVYYFHLDDLFVISLSEKTVKTMVNCYKGTSKACLANRDSYKKLNGSFELDRRGSSQVFVDIEGMVAFLKEAVTMGLMASGNMEHAPKVEVVADKLGLGNLASIFGRSLSKDGVARGETFIATSGEPKGLLNVFPSEPISQDELSRVPKNATSFTIFRFDLPAMYDLCMEVVESIDKNVHTQVQGGITGFSAMLSAGGTPFDLRKDVIGQFGSRCLIYSQDGGQAMGAMMPPIHIFVQVKDYNKLISTLKTVLEGLGNMNPEIGSQVSLTSIEYSGQEIHYIQLPEVPMFTPCFTQIDDYLAFGMQTSDLKKLIKGKGEKKESILDSDDFKKLHTTLPDDAPLYSLSYTKTRETFASTYTQLSMYLPLMTMALPPEIELPVDLQLLPTAECIEKHLFSSMSAEVGVKGNPHLHRYVTYGPVGDEAVKYLLAAGVGGAVFLANTMVIGEATEVAEFASIEVNEEAALKEGELFEKQVRTDLAALSNGCFVYKIEYNKYPASLDELLKPTKDWPSGFYSAKELPRDPWGKPYLYKNLQSEGKKYMIWSSGPNVIDESGAGDDIVKIK
ncbi:MAG: type II secretion system protein GspG [Planctomycetota bacterium]|jgi:hypothetical protein